MKKEPTIGQKISPILQEIEETLWEFEANRPGIKPEFTILGFRGAIKIFTSVLLEKIWQKQETNLITQEERQKLAQEAGEVIRELVKKYTGIDSHNLYKL